MCEGLRVEKVMGLRDGDVLVIKAAKSMNPATLSKYAALVRDQVAEANPGKNIKVFVTTPDVTLDKVDEPAMNAAGWYRKQVEE